MRAWARSASKERGQGKMGRSGVKETSPTRKYGFNFDFCFI
jgi:hypothetical protein